MLHLIAEVETPAAQDIKTWLLVLFFLANGFMAVRKVQGRGEKREITNDPLTVRQHEDYVTEERFNEVHQERTANMNRLMEKFDELGEKVTELPEKIRRERAEDMRDIFNRLNNHAERLARIEGRRPSRPTD